MRGGEKGMSRCGYLVVAGSVHKELVARDLAYVFLFSFIILWLFYSVSALQ